VILLWIVAEWLTVTESNVPRDESKRFKSGDRGSCQLPQAFTTACDHRRVNGPTTPTLFKSYAVPRTSPLFFSLAMCEERVLNRPCS
jgi:hypothetical protein